MSSFMIRFLLCNLLLCVIIALFFAVRLILQRFLTSRLRYRLWYLLLLLLAVPFLPVRQAALPRFFLLPGKLLQSSAISRAVPSAAAPMQPENAGWLYDFSVSAVRNATSQIGAVLFALWLAGMLASLFALLRSRLTLHALEASALPLQKKELRKLYQRCLDELGIRRDIPVYTTAFLKSPVLAGLFRPRIYLSLSLVSECGSGHLSQLRYILLHELQHYRRGDALGNYLGCIAGVVYWMNPLVRLALRQMQNDREIACDASVLMLLSRDAYADYGNALISFVQKTSFHPSPFASGISGTMGQMKKRILNIAGFRPATLHQRLRSLLSFLLATVFLAAFIPALTSLAADRDRYDWKNRGENVTSLNLDEAFQGRDGCFVLYDADSNIWQVYRDKAAITRISPASTFKPYIALHALEAGVITPERSLLSWDGQAYAHEVWNADQTLESAMAASATWYFQALDSSSGLPAIRDFVRSIGYGNLITGSDTASYWYDSTLRISPVEQVEMLQKLYENTLQADPQNRDAVLRSIRLFSSAESTVYGKTGTEEDAGKNVSGWFIGLLERPGRKPCYFAVTVQDTRNAAGADAAELAFSVLSELGLWHQETSIFQ